MLAKNLKSLWITETIRLVEKESGRFADEDVNRQVKQDNESLHHRIVLRAQLLANQNGLTQAQQVLISALKFSFIILLVCATLIGCALAFGSLSQRPVNLYWALFSLLGIHFVSLIIWLLSLCLTPQGGGSLFVHCWLWLAKKLSQKQVVQQMIPAFVLLLGGRVRWLVGTIVNACWTMILTAVTVVLFVCLSTASYSFVWQTTLLSTDAVIAITEHLGALPALLGFTMPNEEIIRLSEQAQTAGDARSAWATWLLGVVVVYGLIVRLLCTLFCGVKWLASCQSVKLDYSHLEYQLLADELQPLTVEIIDRDTVGKTNITQHDGQMAWHGDYQHRFLVAIDVEESWIPPTEMNFLGFLNTSEQRSRILDKLQLKPAKKLLIAVDTNRTPDRGMVNLINQLLKKSEQCRIWQINEGNQINNWQQMPFEMATPAWLVQDDKLCGSH